MDGAAAVPFAGERAGIFVVEAKIFEDVMHT